MGAAGAMAFDPNVTESGATLMPMQGVVEESPEDNVIVSITVEEDMRLRRIGISDVAPIGSRTGEGGSRTEGSLCTMNDAEAGGSLVPMHVICVWKANSSEGAPMPPEPAAATRM